MKIKKMISKGKRLRSSIKFFQIIRKGDVGISNADLGAFNRWKPVQFTSIYFKLLATVQLGTLSNDDDDNNSNVKKQLVLWAKQLLRTCITLFSTFLWRPLHDYDVKPPNLTFYGGRGHTTTNFPSSFLTWIKSLRIQLQEKLPAFDILSGSK